MNNELSGFFRQKAILIVDDDFTSKLLLQEYLCQIETSIFSASSCKEAKEIFTKRSEVILVLLDIRLGDGCGLMLSNELKSIRPNVIIIGQTALNRQVNNCAFDACLIKPISQQLLFETIMRLIK